MPNIGYEITESLSDQRRRRGGEERIALTININLSGSDKHSSEVNECELITT